MAPCASPKSHANYAEVSPRLLNYGQSQMQCCSLKAPSGRNVTKLCSWAFAGYTGAANFLLLRLCSHSVSRCALTKSQFLRQYLASMQYSDGKADCVDPQKTCCQSVQIYHCPNLHQYDSLYQVQTQHAYAPCLRIPLLQTRGTLAMILSCCP